MSTIYNSGEQELEIVNIGGINVGCTPCPSTVMVGLIEKARVDKGTEGDVRLRTIERHKPADDYEKAGYSRPNPSIHKQTEMFRTAALMSGQVYDEVGFHKFKFDGRVYGFETKCLLPVIPKCFMRHIDMEWLAIDIRNHIEQDRYLVDTKKNVVIGHEVMVDHYAGCYVRCGLGMGRSIKLMVYVKDVARGLMISTLGELSYYDFRYSLTWRDCMVNGLVNVINEMRPEELMRDLWNIVMQYCPELNESTYYLYETAQNCRAFTLDYGVRNVEFIKYLDVMTTFIKEETFWSETMFTGDKDLDASIKFKVEEEMERIGQPDARIKSLRNELQLLYERRRCGSSGRIFYL